MEITLQNITKSNVNNIPQRKESPSSYRSLLIVPSRRKHSSGFTQIQVVGVGPNEVLELITTYSDDLGFYMPTPLTEGYESIRMDCLYPSGIMRVWSNYFDFVVSFTSSSLVIKLVRRKQ